MQELEDDSGGLGGLDDTLFTEHWLTEKLGIDVSEGVQGACMEWMGP